MPVVVELKVAEVWEWVGVREGEGKALLQGLGVIDQEELQVWVCEKEGWLAVRRAEQVRCVRMVRECVPMW